MEPTAAVENLPTQTTERRVWESPLTVEFLLRDAQAGASNPSGDSNGCSS